MLFQRELTLAWRQRSDLFNPLVFFLMVTSLMPLGLSPKPELLSVLAPGLLWLMALLACLLSLDGMLRDDYEQGCLEQVLLSCQPLYFVLWVKIIVHWLTTGVPLALLAPLLALLLAMPEAGVWPLFVSLLLGTCALSFIGAIGAALTVSLRQGGVLLSLISLPLYIPVLIFGVAVIDRALAGSAIVGVLLMLALICVLAMALAPLAAVGILRVMVR